VARVLTVLAHGDADGVCSAAVVKAALAGECEAVRVYFTHPVDLAKDFEAFAEGDVYVVDVAISTRRSGCGCQPPGQLGLAANLARGLTGAEVSAAAEERGDIHVTSLRSRRVDLNQFLRSFAKRYGVSGGG
jgi:hypothetical protein